MREGLFEPLSYIKKHRDYLRENYMLGDAETKAYVEDKWQLMTDILETYGYVCTRDWKDELQDFLYFLFRTKAAKAEDICVNSTEWPLPEEGDIPLWCELIDDKLAAKNLAVGCIDTDSDEYTLFICSNEALIALKKVALSINRKIDYAKKS